MSNPFVSLDERETYLKSAVHKATRRLVPFLLLMYVIAFIDRVNIGFAKAELQEYVGISEAAFALGASLFFVTYVIFEIPSNILMDKVGARVWMCRIMATWGLASAATMFVNGDTSFYAIRMVLGAFEAGFFPGAILYLTLWFPDRDRARVTGLFYFGAPLAFIFGAPLSGLLLGLDGVLGLRGFQWMFLIEGLAATAVGVWAYFYLTNKPQDAKWLTAEERAALSAQVELEQAAKTQHDHARGMLSAFKNRTVLFFAVIFFLLQMGVAVITFYLPTQVAALLGKKAGFEVGVVVAIPWLCALIATFLVPRLAERHQKLRHYGFGAMATAAIGLTIAAFANAEPLIALAALSLAVAGMWAVQPMFWTLLTDRVAGAVAVTGIALVNTIGNIGNFVSPNVKVFSDRHLGAPFGGLITMAIIVLIGSTMFLVMRKPPVEEAIESGTPPITPGLTPATSNDNAREEQK